MQSCVYAQKIPEKGLTMRNKTDHETVHNQEVKVKETVRALKGCPSKHRALWKNLEELVVQGI